MRKFLLSILTALVLALPATALAQTPTDDVYDPVDARTESSISNSPSSSQHASSGLAFTGLDIGLVAVAGAAILGTGLALRRASRTD